MNKYSLALKYVASEYASVYFSSSPKEVCIDFNLLFIHSAVEEELPGTVLKFGDAVSIWVNFGGNKPRS